MKKILAFFQKYPTVVHFFLFVWNAFITSWSTKTAVPLGDLGIPLVVNASVIVSKLQAYLHIPTTAIATFTFALNGVVAYTAWKKNHDSQTKTE